jgi:hypothetical protein
MLLLRDLAAQVLQNVADDPEGVGVNLAEIYSRLDAWGEMNPHLKNPSRHPVAKWSTPREQPLSGDEEVHGDYLLFVWCSHDPFIHLREYESRETLEATLLSGGGAFNPFLTYLVPFIEGKVAQFRVTFRREDGEVACLAKYPGSKWPKFDPLALETAFPGRKLEWLAT